MLEYREDLLPLNLNAILPKRTGYKNWSQINVLKSYTGYKDKIPLVVNMTVDFQFLHCVYEKVFTHTIINIIDRIRSCQKKKKKNVPLFKIHYLHSLDKKKKVYITTFKLLLLKIIPQVITREFFHQWVTQ